MPSELQTRAEVESVIRDAIADVEVVDPARAKIEVALTQLGRVGNNWADAAQFAFHGECGIGEYKNNREHKCA